MSDRRLNILGIEPYFGGHRRAMFELISRHSRHRWDWRTLGPRRMHRRLAAAAGWFADDLDRRPPRFGPDAAGGVQDVGGARERVDVLFVSEAMHLGDLLRCAPSLAATAKVLYVHDHDVTALPADDPQFHYSPWPPGLEKVYLMAASVMAREPRGQLWFATAYHAAAYLARIDELYRRHAGLFPDDPRAAIEDRARIVAPPVGHLPAVASAEPPSRRRVLISADAADGTLMGELFRRVLRRDEPFELLTLGTVNGLGGIPHRTITPTDPTAVAGAFVASRAYLGGGRDVWFDPWAVQALRKNLWVLVPGQGVQACYDEIIPASLQPAMLHDNTVGRLIVGLQTAWHAGRPEVGSDELAAAIGAYDPETAVAEIDERIEQLVEQQAAERRT